MDPQFCHTDLCVVVAAVVHRGVRRDARRRAAPRLRLRHVRQHVQPQKQPRPRRQLLAEWPGHVQHDVSPECEQTCQKRNNVNDTRICGNDRVDPVRNGICCAQQQEN